MISDNDLIKQNLLPLGVIQLYSRVPAYVWSYIIKTNINHVATETVAKQLKT